LLDATEREFPPTIKDRVAWADAALRTFQKLINDDGEYLLVDLLGELVHWADAHGQDFDEALQDARGHHAAEVEEAADAHA
jgi:hypothetical protein